MRLIAVLAAASIAACSHPLEIRNLDDYPATAGEPLERPTTVGVIAQAPDESSRELVRGIGGALGKYAAQVRAPYAPGVGPPPDAIARVTVTPRYEGTGRNTFVTLPGALVLAPMWAGYAYGVHYDVQILLTRGWDNAKIDAWTVPLSLDVRHADGPRLGGYDPTVTPQVMAQARDALGDHVARDIVQRLNQSDLLWKLTPPPDTLAARGNEPASAAPGPVSPPSPEPPVQKPAPAATTPARAANPTAPPPPQPATAPATTPAAPPSMGQPSAGLATGIAARLKPGATVRNRPMPSGQPVDVGRATAAKLGASIVNDSGTWWYVTVAGQNGWVLDAELGAAP